MLLSWIGLSQDYQLPQHGIPVVEWHPLQGCGEGNYCSNALTCFMLWKLA